MNYKKLFFAFSLLFSAIQSVATTATKSTAATSIVRLGPPGDMPGDDERTQNS